MRVINKKYEDTVSFDSLKVGDVFLDIDSTIYMKILSVDYCGYKFNAVSLSSGNLAGYEDDCQVVAVEAEVSYR